MGLRGNPYGSAKAESIMKTLKVEAVYPMARCQGDHLTPVRPQEPTPIRGADADAD
jgi:putative transposase